MYFFFASNSLKPARHTKTSRISWFTNVDKYSRQFFRSFRSFRLFTLRLLLLLLRFFCSCDFRVFWLNFTNFCLHIFHYNTQWISSERLTLEQAGKHIAGTALERRCWSVCAPWERQRERQSVREWFASFFFLYFGSVVVIVCARSLALLSLSTISIIQFCVEM